MESRRFDAIARALASGVSRRQLLKAALAGAAASLLPSRAGHLIGAQSPVCALDEILCSERCVDNQIDVRNCGVCGEVCAPGRQCVDGLCQPPIEQTTGCRSQHVRLWFGAFIPWVENGNSTFAVVDGVERSLLHVPLPGSNPPVPEALLVANRQGRTSFESFSREIDARSLAHHELLVDLTQMSVTETPKPNRALAQVAWQGGGPDPHFTLACERTISGPHGINGLPWLAIDPDGDNAIQFLIDAIWEVDQGGSQPGCVLDSIDFGPIRLKGILRVVRDDVNGVVDLSFTEEVFRNKANAVPLPGQVGPFPAIELYASLDDGNMTPVFRYAPDETWAAHDLNELRPVPPEALNLCAGSKPCPAGVARLTCGCESCLLGGGVECIGQVGPAPCQEIPGYFVLSGNPTFDPTIDVVCSDPDCPTDAACIDACKSAHIDADGLVEVFVGTSATPVYRSDPTARGKLPPVGLRLFRDDVITVVANRSANSIDGLSNLYLHRIDGVNGPIATQRPPAGGRPLTPKDNDRIQVSFEVTLGPSGRGVPICCQDVSEQVCVDRTASLRNCGGCNRQCPDGQLCLSGECVCPYPLVFHNNACVDPTQDATACGPNFLDCTADGKVCARSICLPSGCTDIDNHVCDDDCFALTDAAHCGPACVTCSVPENGEARCDDGLNCTIVCNDGFHSCDTVTCSDNTSPLTCGFSCTPCEAPANATADCNEGICSWHCNPGFISCDGASCVDPSSPWSCGESCAVCPDWAPNCLFGTCCPTDAVDVCGGVCSNLTSDKYNCGGCGTPCDQCCVGGLCANVLGSFGHCTDCYVSCTFPETCEPNPGGGSQCFVLPIEPPFTECPCGFIGNDCIPGPCEG